MARYDRDCYPTLRESLERAFVVDDLRLLARIINGSSQGKKEDLIRTILRATEGNGIERLFNTFRPLQKTAVAEAVHCSGGTFDASRFSAKYGPEALRTLQDLRDKKETPWSLFFVGGKIPVDLAMRLKAFVPPPKEDELRTLDRLPDRLYFDEETSDVQEIYAGDPAWTDDEGTPFHVRHTDRAALNNLRTLLLLADQGKIKVGPKTGHPSAATLKTLATVLDGGDWFVPGQEFDEDFDDYCKIDPIQAFAWPLLLQGAGLASIEGGALRLTRTGKAALNADPAGTIRAIWNKWEKTVFFDEFSRINAIRGQGAKSGRHMVSPAHRRPVINEALAECPPGSWIAFDEFGRFMIANDYLFEVTRDLWKLYIADPQYGSLGYMGFAPWSVLQGRYVMVYLFEYAATLGLVDIAYLPPDYVRNDYRGNGGTDDMPYLSRYDGLCYFRINPLGAYVLGLTERYESAVQEEVRALKVLPNMDIVLVDRTGLPPVDLMFLDSFTEKVSEAVWRLAPRTILESAEKGTSLSDIESFLAARSADPLPQTVTTLLEDMKGRVTKFAYGGRAHLLSCTDPALIALAATNRTLSTLCMPAGDNHLCILPGKEKNFVRALGALGYTVPRLREILEL